MSSQERAPRVKKPDWLKLPRAGGAVYAHTSAAIHKLGLATVCEEARCPNRGECWGEGTATVMILGDVCTRNCRFCSVGSGEPQPVDTDEPRRVAEAVKQLNLKYVVLTSVDRDDLPDYGAAHFAAVVGAIKTLSPDILVEVLTPDFQGHSHLVAQVAGSGVSVFGHNVEVPRRLTKLARDRRCSFDTSLSVLRVAKRMYPHVLTKSSLMLGLGETEEEILDTLKELHENGVDMVTLGQYLQPGRPQMEVEKYYSPDEFADLEEKARTIGFTFVAAGPHVRSSYRAGELFVQGHLAAKKAE